MDLFAPRGANGGASAGWSSDDARGLMMISAPHLRGG